ncbi:olfactory receptor 1f45-like [Ambystoma mexicanum]|uniref:olfactory receptor 1f45-like n=1 Tax=Ambystoma mexicanum TaxID=8296 RepID=UPI0037E7F495
MKRLNQSSVKEFLLLGFSSHPEKQTLLFFVFLTMYTVILVGNLTIFTIIRMDSRLHTPMYFFLSTLACVDICFTSMTVPKLLVDLLSAKKTISFSSCIVQLHFFLSFGNMDSFLLGIMGFDRYMAICRPLHYAQIMRKRLCILLVLAAWVIVSLHSSVHSILASRLLYCGSNEIHHFYCDLPPLLKLSCSDTSANELVLFTETTIILLTPLLCILLSYFRIAIVIMKIRSSDGRRKAFSTCVSHLISIVLFYGPVLFTYIRPSSAYSLDRDIGISVMYSIVTSMLNPFVYSIRNNDVKEALRKLESKIPCHR